MAVKRMSIKAPAVMLLITVPFAFFMNVLLFGSVILHDVTLLFKTLLFTWLYIFATNFLYDAVARLYLRKFPLVTDMFQRIIHMLPSFYLLNCIVIPGLYFLYKQFGIIGYPPRAVMIFWAIFYACCSSTLVTFFNVGVANWAAWKKSINATEKLKNVYQRSKVLGLKGQLNPHFLFNCFNTLSGLIQENEAKAEIFLDEMTKVHRYLLRSDDELLVPLADEIKFAQSYLYLAKERFGGAISSVVNIDDTAIQKKLPPLSMQVILEYIIYTNALSKNDPVSITITSGYGNELTVTHSLHKKTVLQNLDVDDGLDNLINKYKMLKGGEVKIDETENSRTLLLPLFNGKEGFV